MRSINSNILPDGATVFDNQSDTLWQLDKSAGTTYDVLLGSGLVLQPDDQTSARWLALTISGSSPFYNTSYLVAPVVLITASSQWVYLGNNAASFALSTGVAAAFTVNPTTGEVTYNGPPRLALVSAEISVANASAAILANIRACISRNGDVVAGTTTDYRIKGEQSTTAEVPLVQRSTQRVMLLNPNTSLRLALRNATNGDDLQIDSYQLSVIPLG